MDAYDYGSGLLGGVTKAIEGYGQASERRQLREMQEAERRRAQAMELAKLRAQGFDVSEGPEGFEIKPSELTMKKEKAQGLLQAMEKGLIPEYDESGLIPVSYRRDPEYMKMKNEGTEGLLKQLQAQKLMGELQEQRQKAQTEETKKSETAKQELRTAQIINEDIDRAFKVLENPLASGQVAGRTASFGVGPAARLDKILDSVRSNITFDKLTQLKKAAGGIGAISDMEMKMLQATAGSLDPRLPTEELKKNLSRLQEQFQQVISNNTEQKQGLLGTQGAQAAPPPEIKQWQGKTYRRQGDMWVEVK